MVMVTGMRTMGWMAVIRMIQGEAIVVGWSW